MKRGSKCSSTSIWEDQAVYRQSDDLAQHPWKPEAKELVPVDAPTVRLRQSGERDGYPGTEHGLIGSYKEGPYPGDGQHEKCKEYG